MHVVSRLLCTVHYYVDVNVLLVELVWVGHKIVQKDRTTAVIGAVVVVARAELSLPCPSE